MVAMRTLMPSRTVVWVKSAITKRYLSHQLSIVIQDKISGKKLSVDKRLAALETRLANMEKNLESMEAGIGTRLTSLENILQTVLSAVKSLTPVNPTV